MLLSFGLKVVNRDESEAFSVIAVNENELIAFVYSSTKNSSFLITNACSSSHRLPLSNVLKNIHS